MEQITKKRKASLAQKVAKLRDEVLPANEANLRKTEEVNERLTQEAEGVRSKIRSVGKRAVHTVEAFVEKEIQEVDDLETARLKFLEKQKDDLKRQIDDSERALLFHEALVAEASTLPVVLLKAVDERITALCAEKVEEVTTSQSRLGFEESCEKDLLAAVEKSIGRVLSLQASAHTSFVQDNNEKLCRLEDKISFTLQPRDDRNVDLPSGGDSVTCRCVKGCSTAELCVKVSDDDNGQYVISC